MYYILPVEITLISTFYKDFIQSMTSPLTKTFPYS